MKPLGVLFRTGISKLRKALETPPEPDHIAMAARNFEKLQSHKKKAEDILKKHELDNVSIEVAYFHGNQSSDLALKGKYPLAKYGDFRKALDEIQQETGGYGFVYGSLGLKGGDINGDTVTLW